MIRVWIKWLLAGWALVLISGCATTYYRQGVKHLESGRYRDAIQTLAQGLKEDPTDADIIRELGIAFLYRGKQSPALPVLRKAFSIDSTDGKTLLYLGVAFERNRQYKQAIDHYRRYASVNPANAYRKIIEGRFHYLIRKQMAAEARALLAQENALNPLSFDENTVAVLNFKNIGNNRVLDPLQKGITEMVITDLSKVKALKLVERTRMQILMDEMDLSQTGLIDESTAPRIGRLLGASRLVNGSYVDLTGRLLRMDAGLVHIADTEPVSIKPVTGGIDRLFQIEKDLIFRILDSMHITLTQKERDDIEIIPTENILAFMAYCRGLDYEDKGMFGRAAEEYRKALKLDPGFQAAGRNLQKTASITAAANISDLSRLEEITADIAIESDRVFSMTQTDQLIHVGDVLNRTFLPGIEERKSTQEGEDVGFGNSINFFMRVPLPQRDP